MATVYGLFTCQLCWYVGSTTRSLQERLREHKAARGLGGSLIPPLYDWEIRQLESVNVENRFACERKWVDALKPFYNQKVPGRSQKEYSEEFRDRTGGKAQKGWNDRNRDKMREAQQRWRTKKKAQQNLEPA